MRLQLTKRTDYAIRACVYLAARSGDGPASSRRIAREMEIPEGFLPRVLGDLADAGIVGSQLGRSGGYWLQLSPDNLSVLNLIEIVEGPSRSDTCVLRQRACDGSRPCAFHPVWDEAQTAFINVLATTTLAELAASGVGGTASHRGTT
jgi:Rrf2 family iron-sulfur cluster assembly transcriptional regulator